MALVGLLRAPRPVPGPPAAPAPGRWRLWLVLLTLGWHGMFMVSPAWQDLFGFNRGTGPYPLFIDSLGVLAAAETSHLGGDPFEPMRLDPYHRRHVYSSWWFVLGDWGLTRADNLWVGGLCVLALAVAAGIRLRVRAQGEFWWLLGTACSAPVLLATTRANSDLVMFALLAPLPWCLTQPSRLVRLVAPFLIAAAAGLKFYPVVAAVLLLAEPDRRDRRFRLAVLFLLLLMAVPSAGVDLIKILAFKPVVNGYLGFGAGFGLDVIGLPADWQARAGLIAGLALGLAAFFTRGWGPWLKRMAGEEQGLQFILGAVLLAGCFWTGLSWAYRWVFALWLVPFLWRPVEALAAMPAGARLCWRVARAAYWPALWGGCVQFLIYHPLLLAGHPPPWQVNLACWALVQAAAWTFCGALTVLVGAFAWTGLGGLFGSDRDGAAAAVSVVCPAPVG